MNLENEVGIQSAALTPSLWIPVAKQMPHDGQLVVLRMAETSERRDIHYGIGWYDGPTMENTGWVITSSPQTKVELEVIAWFEVPK